ncbi:MULTISPECIES: hypothetical protein [unclassified Novosphingobium]|uniref:hypothetical protein n=1 Tax=unclassified Novosphingobium TaxID=2644732 RepID=UPI0014942BC6|nr:MULTISPECIES: hypothetical protein [unclassified Novosphingobium]MBB3357046.1 hypothetical protein [Novosphingobium sp. BK256]MBB3373447.1 hypothetical protein [Novosphingobium sp. BK280]MBB3377816.1 hypothetical protein [Novosphingobium sp. BK258]MBB3418773.1 hypothetical protein [Novosphingobium sp. BK267]MBB3450392.1 hypothetical protein [Novosphingobium sp. BK352]
MRKSDDLKAEYLLIQGQYEAFDQRALSMKALATPLLGAGLAVAIKDDSHALLFATMLVALTLWVLESVWKGFQYCLTDRIIALEAWFRGEESEEMAPFQIYTAWGEVYRRERLWYIVTRMWAPFIALPYAVVIAVCIGVIVTR